jgi:hypothetical protein
LDPAPTDAIPPAAGRAPPGSKDGSLLLVFAWAAVGVPLAWGVWTTLLKTAALFR